MLRDAVAADAQVLGGLIGTQKVRVAQASGGVGFLARLGSVVDALYLSAGARGQGLGKALLNNAKAMGDLVLWTFQANLGVRRFYLREGFREGAWTDCAGSDERLPDVRLDWSA